MVLSLGDFTIDRGDERVIGAHGPIKIGNKAYRLLLLLIEHEGRLVTKDTIFDVLWDNRFVSEAALTSVVKELRRALNDDSRDSRYIETVYGRGYRLRETAAAAAAAPLPTRRTSAMPTPADAAGPPLILIAPFEDVAAQASFPHLAAQIRGEILTGLARIREIRLIADTGAGAPPTLHTTRAYRLTASLSPDDDGAKIIARLERLSDGLVVWAETLSFGAAGHAIQQIVRRIIGAILPAIDERTYIDLPVQPDDWYDRYLVAKRLSLTTTHHAVAREAAETLEALIAERPGFAPAYPPLVRLYNTDFNYTELGTTGAAERARALDLAKAGLAADRGDAHAHAVLGFCYLWHNRHQLARQCFERVLLLNPYNHVRLQEAATAATYTEDFESARELMARAAELNPIPDDTYFEDLGRLQLISGDVENAGASLEAVLHGSIWAPLYAALCRVDANRDGARDMIDRWRSTVAARWRSHAEPGNVEIRSWIMLHHPIAGTSGERFRALVDSALPDSRMPRSSTKVSMKQV